MLSQTKEFKNCWARDIIDEKSNVLLCPDASLSLRLPNNVEKWPNILQKSCDAKNLAVFTNITDH